MLNARTQLGENIIGHVGGQLGTEEDADALGADQLDRLLDLLQERLGRILEQQVRLVEEEHQFRLVDVTDLRQVGEQVGQHPHQKRREHHRPSRLVAELEQRDHATPLRVDPQQIRRIDLWLAEKRVAAVGFKVDQGAQNDTRGL